MANKENLMIVCLQQTCISCLEEMLCGSTCFATDTKKSSCDGDAHGIFANKKHKRTLTILFVYSRRVYLALKKYYVDAHALRLMQENSVTYGDAHSIFNRMCSGRVEEHIRLLQAKLRNIEEANGID
ncbi:hypothetical protein Tco_1140055 [Tanacetum coccineum]